MGKKTVLMIDDEPDFIETVKMRLEPNGYEVLDANDGDVGIAAARKSQPSVILLDLVMPKLNGIATLQTLKADPRTAHIPVIIITGKHESEFAFDAAKLGASDYVVKPPSIDLLLQLVAKYAAP